MIQYVVRREWLGDGTLWEVVDRASGQVASPFPMSYPAARRLAERYEQHDKEAIKEAAGVKL